MRGPGHETRFLSARGWRGALAGAAVLGVMVAGGGRALAANGGAWTAGPVAAGVPGGATSIAFDGATSQLILFGGNLPGGALTNETWLWSGSGWTKLSPPNSPPAREAAAMAYDAATRQLILFGGTDDHSNVLGDTWEWDGSTWTQVASSSPGLYGASMAYDPASRQLIMFGGDIQCGCYGSPSQNRTYSWDGTSWSEIRPQTYPPGRYDASMAYDSATRQLVLFGGSNGSQFWNDTWTWTGTNWVELVHDSAPNTPNVPSARMGAAMDFDTAASQMILFGGTNGSVQTNQSDTWTWTGTSWQQLFPSTSPPPHVDANGVNDPLTGQFLLHGGGNQGPLFDTWLWSPTSSSPPLSSATGGGAGTGSHAQSNPTGSGMSSSSRPGGSSSQSPSTASPSNPTTVPNQPGSVLQGTGTDSPVRAATAGVGSAKGSRSGSSGLPLILVALAVVLLAGGSGAASWRRRQTRPQGVEPSSHQAE